MKLVWKDAGTGYTAEGHTHSYAVNAHTTDRTYTWEVVQTRQPGGQVVSRNHCVSLEGAFARAQIWESGHAV